MLSAPVTKSRQKPSAPGEPEKSALTPTIAIGGRRTGASSYPAMGAFNA